MSLEMTNERKLKRGDQVVYKCTNPATGWVLRVAKDGTWADVRWDFGMDHRYVARHETKNMMRLNPLFNRLATDPFARIFLEEPRAVNCVASAKER